MWLYLGVWTTVICILILLIYLTYYFGKVYLGSRSLKSAKEITKENFEVLDLKEIKADYELPKGQQAYFTYEANRLQFGQKVKQYNGGSLSSINLWLAKLSFQRRGFVDQHVYVSRGFTTVTLTNKVLSVDTLTEPTFRFMNLNNIRSIKLADSSKTVYIAPKKETFPMKITFETAQEAEEFQNAMYTLIYTFTGATKPEHVKEYLLGKAVKAGKVGVK